MEACMRLVSIAACTSYHSEHAPQLGGIHNFVTVRTMQGGHHRCLWKVTVASTLLDVESSAQHVCVAVWARSAGWPWPTAVARMGWWPCRCCATGSSSRCPPSESVMQYRLLSLLT